MLLAGCAPLMLAPALVAHGGDYSVSDSAITIGLTIAVDNCNDSGAGSLRHAVATATSGDTIDMTALACRRIDLASGAIEITQDDLSLVGGPPRLMKVDAGHNSSVFRHSGTGTLHIKRMNIARGTYSDEAAPLGGCLYSEGSIEIVDSIVHGCRTRSSTHAAYEAGGGIYAKGAVKLVHSQVVDNIVYYGYGGAIFAGGRLTTVYSRICRNRVRGGVGIVFSDNGLDARNTTFCKNQGGGIWAQNGTIIIANSIISDNVGSNILFLSASPETGSMSIVDSTISGNTDTYGTPILDMQRESPKSISNSTIAFNQQLNSCGPSAGTVRVMGPEPTLLDSTIISNSLCNGAPGYAITKFEFDNNAALLGANNLITGPSNLELPPDTIFTDPKLAALARNGGPTRTHALLDDSPAIDMGNNEAGLAFDQRGKGYPREKGMQADIGAYER